MPNLIELCLANGYSNYVCPEKIKVLASQMTEIRSITNLFIV